MRSSRGCTWCCHETHESVSGLTGVMREALQIDHNVGVASLLRSVLFVPGTRADRFPKAMAAGADAVVLDLEDGVDASRKVEARRTVSEWLTSSPASTVT